MPHKRTQTRHNQLSPSRRYQRIRELEQLIHTLENNLKAMPHDIEAYERGWLRLGELKLEYAERLGLRY